MLLNTMLIDLIKIIILQASRENISSLNLLDYLFTSNHLHNQIYLWYNWSYDILADIKGYTIKCICMDNNLIAILMMTRQFHPFFISKDTWLK